MTSTLTGIEHPIPSNVTGAEVTISLPYDHMHDKIQAQRPWPRRITPSDILVEFEDREVSQMINVCSLIRTKAQYPQASMWGPSEILQVQELYDMLKPKFNNPDDERALMMDLAESRKLGLQNGGLLVLKPEENIATRVAQTDKLGENDHWSASGLMHHLSLLDRLVSQPKQAPATQLWVNSFFFRVAAMLPPGRHMVLKLEQADAGLPLSDVPGSANWIVLLTSNAAGFFVAMDPLVVHLHRDPEAPVFFVSERRHNQQFLSAVEHVLPAVRDMHRWARTRGKNVIRGAVTDGEEWVYLVLKLDQRGGGVWMQSGVHRITGDFGKLSEFEVARIPTILVHWMMHSHEDLGDDDYFEIKTTF